MRKLTERSSRTTLVLLHRQNSFALQQHRLEVAVQTRPRVSFRYQEQE